MTAKIVIGVLAAITIGVIAYVWSSDTHLRGEALEVALQPIAAAKGTDASVVAAAIVGNYRETRQIASLWSFLYWGFAWGAAVLSALAGLILKLESLGQDEKRKKDIAALLTTTAALLVTISTGGDFQRKWQANRTAAAEIERTGYEFLEHQGGDGRGYLSQVRDALYQRHMAILGGKGKGASEARGGSDNQ